MSLKSRIKNSLRFQIDPQYLNTPDKSSKWQKCDQSVL